jgi:hypothetical protein
LLFAQVVIHLLYALYHHWDDRHVPTHSALLNWDGGLTNFLSGWAWNHDPPKLSFPSSWDYRYEPPSTLFPLGSLCPESMLQAPTL